MQTQHLVTILVDDLTSRAARSTDCGERTGKGYNEVVNLLIVFEGSLHDDATLYRRANVPRPLNILCCVGLSGACHTPGVALVDAGAMRYNLKLRGIVNKWSGRAEMFIVFVY